jgi:hypothetical protein
VNEFDGRNVMEAPFLWSISFTNFAWCWWICLAVAWVYRVVILEVFLVDDRKARMIVVPAILVGDCFAS